MRRLTPVAALIAVGAAWGLSVPLTRIATATGHAPLGLIVWQQVIMAGCLLAAQRLLRLPLPRSRRWLGLFGAVALFGTILPGYFSFLTAPHLPAGVRSILLASVPIFVLPMSLALGFERPDPRRALGIALGAGAIAVIALPGSEASDAIALGMILLMLLAPLSYAAETIYLAWRGAGGLHPVQVLLGASILGIAIAWPLAVATGQTVDLARRWGPAEAAVLASGLLNAVAYVGYVWLIGRAGSVFASQIAYLVTGFGVAWSWALLGERYGVWVWAGFLLMLAAVALIRPQSGRDEKA